MTKFREGDHVRVVQLTDVDVAPGDPNRVFTTNDAAIRAFGGEIGPMIGDTAVVVVPAMDDSYEVLVGFEGETYAVSDDDLVLVEGERA